MNWKSISEIIVDPISGEWGEEGDGVKVLRTTNFSNDGRLNLSDVVKRNVDLKKIEKKKLKVGDSIIEKSGGSPSQPVGRVVYFDVDNEDFICNNFTSILRLKNNDFDSRYFFWNLFYQHSVKNTLRFQNKTTGIINLQLQRYLTETRIKHVSLPTQKHIASILDKADALRQQNRQLLNYYDELLQSTFIEMFGDPMTNNGGWAVKKLDEIAEVVSGVAKNTGLAGDLIEVPYMRVANVQDGTLDLREIKTIRVFKRDYEKYQLKSGDVLMTEGGDPDKLGRAAIWGEEIPDCIHQNHIFRVRPNYQIADSEFLCSQFGSIYGKKYFLRAAKQTTGIASINMTQLKNFPVLVPPIEMQKEFKDVMHKIRRQKEILSSEIIEQDMLFNTLLAKYFTNN